MKQTQAKEHIVQIDPDVLLRVTVYLDNLQPTGVLTYISMSLFDELFIVHCSVCGGGG